MRCLSLKEKPVIIKRRKRTNVSRKRNRARKTENENNAKLASRTIQMLNRPEGSGILQDETVF
jgi:hypothetical protein